MIAKSTPESIAESCRRILERARIGPARPEPTYRCRCKGTGLLMYAEGTFDVGWEGRVVEHVASRERPVMGRCPACNPRRRPDGPVREFGSESAPREANR